MGGGDRFKSFGFVSITWSPPFYQNNGPFSRVCRRGVPEGARTCVEHGRPDMPVKLLFGDISQAATQPAKEKPPAVHTCSQLSPERPRMKPRCLPQSPAEHLPYASSPGHKPSPSQAHHGPQTASTHILLDASMGQGSPPPVLQLGKWWLRELTKMLSKLPLLKGHPSVTLPGASMGQL